MDREFIERNQIVERYLAGRLPPRGAVEFEHFCAAHPELLDSLGLAERVHAGLRLLDAGGKPSPWEQKQRPVWEKPPVLIGFAVLVVILLGAAAALALKVGDRGAKIAALEQRIVDQPLAPATSTRTIKLVPARGGPTHKPAVTVGGGPVQFADLKIDLAWSKYSNFRITIDRENQGRVAVLHNIEKDSNGHVRIAFNTSALGPGNYDFTIQGLTWRGEPVGQAWATIGIQR
ncbi:MAG: hypothetical protein AB7G76_01340 [Steroidobacteraceae bacterium]